MEKINLTGVSGWTDKKKLLDYETIKAAVAGEKWATEKVLAHYADYIDELPAGTRITIKRAAPSGNHWGQVR